ncbi:MAG TPA: P-loop NTPase fold protein [Candidatus Acidoferrum sp.]|nr:P-loop NTPase fold protein [Candidatus Acidoferrum sp.]
MELGAKATFPGIAWGALIGSVTALLLPSAISISAVGLQKLSHFPESKLGQLLNPFWKAMIAPNHLALILLTAALGLLTIGRKTILEFFTRLYNWTIYEPTLLWAIGSFVVCAYSPQRAGIALCAVLSLTCVIAWRRSPYPNTEETLINPDQPIQDASEDKLDRQSLVASLVCRLLQDGAPVISVTGGYGDGKTSILNLLAEALRAEKVIVINFKTSLPGDDLTLASTLFNSLRMELHRHFFVRRLGNILRNLARKFSGLVPSAPSGLKELFAEASQEAELRDLTAKLEGLPIRRVVVLLDDMDRMQGSELRTLLKIIRTADNYPKLSFVCALNKRALVDVLVRHQVIDRVTLKLSATAPAPIQGRLSGEVTADDTRIGYEYLEKFFPVQVPVPKLDDAQLSKEFEFRFNQFAQHHGLPMAPEEMAAFNNEFNPYWKPLFRLTLSNLRKLNSYFNALNSSFALVRHEVNLIDFMFVELLRQLDPEIYEQVFRNRTLFYYAEWDLYRWDERSALTSSEEEKERARLYKAYDEIFLRRQDPERALILLLLGRLFPKVAEYHKARLLGTTGKLSEQEADRQKRIYHPYYFLIYFSLHVEEGYVGAKELEQIIENADRIQDPTQVETYFAHSLATLRPIKRYRFFEKLERSEERLGAIQAKALAIAIALEANKLEYDELDIGEFRLAANLALTLANRFRDTHEITQLLEEIITRSSTDAFAYRLLEFATNQERNKTFESWENVIKDELESAFVQRLKAKYRKGGDQSIYSPGTNFRDWQALVWWSRHSDKDAEDVNAYLEDEFEHHPASIGKHIHWLWSTVASPSGKQLVDKLFSLSRLQELARMRGKEAYSTDPEKKTVESLIQGDWPVG